MRLSVIGGGQLARMMALSGIPMGLKFSFLLKDEESDRCIKGLGDAVRFDPNDDAETIYQKLGCPDVVTIESENVDVELLQNLSELVPVRPDAPIVHLLKNRIHEKELLRKVGIDTSRFFSCQNYADIVRSAREMTFPFVIKSATGGYDGKNQWLIREESDLDDIGIQKLEGGCIVEEFVEFHRELSFIAVRSVDGDMKYYSPAENVHQKSILLSSVAPAREVDNMLIDIAHSWLAQLMHGLNYVGVLAMECFHTTRDGMDALLVNELAPRVHNSGHWTQAGCHTNQFENHLRAILGLSIGSTDETGFTGMLNVLGKEVTDLSWLTEHTSVHTYNKELRENRKMGHININSQDYEQLLVEMTKVSDQLNQQTDRFEQGQQR